MPVTVCGDVQKLIDEDDDFSRNIGEGGGLA